MSRAQYLNWQSAGSRWTLCSPARILRDALRARGYTVFDLGNDSHMLADPPEDHTPFSATGWPEACPAGIVTAIDVMPPDNAARARAGKATLPSLQVLGAQLHADKVNGKFPPIKYMNWGPVDDGHAVHCGWKPDHAQSSSTDTGHIHISFRTDMLNWSGAYDPLAAPVAPTSEDTMLSLWVNPAGPGFYLCDGMTSRPIVAAQLPGLRWLRDQKLITVADSAPGQNTLEFPFKTGWSEACGALPAAAAAAPTMDVAALAEALTPALVAALATQLHSVDEATVAAAVGGVLSRVRIVSQAQA